MSQIQRVFVTGAGTGLGRGLADHYAREGAHLGLVARREPLLREVQKEWTARGARVEVYPGDVTDTEFMVRCANQFVAAAGGVDLVFANAGIGIPDRTLDGESQEIARLMEVNVVGVTNTVIPFAPYMVKQQSGILCATSSVAGHRAMPGRTAYSSVITSDKSPCKSSRLCYRSLVTNSAPVFSVASCAPSVTTLRTLNVIMENVIRQTVRGMHSSPDTCVANMAGVITAPNT